MTHTLEDRVRLLEAKVRELEGALTESRQSQQQQPVASDAAPAPRPEAPHADPAARPQPAAQRREPFDFSSLLSARSLAWVGGAAVLLGLVFLFAMAIDRGWINEQARVILGASISFGLLGAGFYLRDRQQRSEAALASAATGIAGLYASLLAASPLYDLVAEPLAVALAVGVAITAVAISLRWSARSVAALGLVGAMIASPLVLEDVTLGSLAIVATAMLAAAWLLVWRGWEGPIVLGAIVSLPQAVAWIFENSDRHPEAIGVAVTFWLILASAGFLFQLRRADQPLQTMPAWIVAGGAMFALLSVTEIVEGKALGLDSDGLAIGGLALPYLLAAPLVYRWKGASARDLASVVGAIGLALVAVAVFIVLGSHLVVPVLAAQAVILAFLAKRLEEPRVLFGALAYAGLALGYLVMAEAPPTHLFDESIQPYRIGAEIRGTSPEFGLEILSVIAATVGALGLSWATHGQLRRYAAWSAAALTIYAFSLATLWLFVSYAEPGTTSSTFQSAHTAISILWGVIGLGALVAGLRTRLPDLRLGGFALFGLALGKLVLYDLATLTAMARAVSFLVVGLVFLIAAAIYQRLTEREAD